MFTDPFVQRALLAGLLTAWVAAPLGCFVVWRRMAYFGDSLAHAALSGVALGVVLGWDLRLSTMAACGLFAALLLALQHRRILEMDTLLGILAHAALAGGLIAVSVLPAGSLNLHGLLFGDILAIGWAEVGAVALGAAVVLVLLVVFWRRLLLACLDEVLARAEGVSPLLAQGLLLGLMTVTVAVTMRVVGILLITALLVIPAAAARLWARSPESMALGAAGLASLGVMGGLAASFYLDLPAGPAVVAAVFGAFVLCLLARILQAVLRP